MNQLWVFLVLAFVQRGRCFTHFLPALSSSSSSSLSIRHNAASKKNIKVDRVFSTDPKVDPDVAAFLEGKPRKWSGRWDIMKRRGQMPSPEYSPVEVVVTILKALKNNDDPQIDHGAAVVLAFASPDGALKKSGVDPAQYGLFLSTNYPALLDFKSAELLGDTNTKMIDNTTTTFRQPIRASGWSGASFGTFEFILTRCGESSPWLVDAIVAAKP
jgi:hypothetical protein